MRRRPLFRPQFAVPVLFILGSAGTASSMNFLSAADEPKQAGAPDQADKGGAPAHPVPVPHPGRPKGNEFLTALTLWCGIVVVGLALLTVVMVWGRWLRRIARRTPTTPTVPDPLWYLKTKQPPQPSATAGSAPGDTSRSPDEGDSGSNGSGRTAL